MFRIILFFYFGFISFCFGQKLDILEKITITGTRTSKKQTQNPVNVHIISSKKLEQVQACSLADGLVFQSGLRVEMNCQTCHYSQLRMNGLAGGYSQILINGRPIFSALAGLYGLEQIPANMIHRIEIVKGGGSALYGSSAIGGTLNILTKMPQKNNYEINSIYQNIKKSNDIIFQGNATVLNENKKAGVSFFVNNRTRQMQDANGDHFSELPELKNNGFGVNAFYEPTEFEKITFHFNTINEYRYGGEMVKKQPHFALQSEERIHNIYTANLDYKKDFNHSKSNIFSYLAGQYTDRKHYTGILPEETQDLKKHYENPPYGISFTETLQAGLQINHTLEHFLKGTAKLTFGTEYLQDAVFDEIKTYDYKINQKTQNIGFFLQNDWELNPKTSILMGIRLDKHNMLRNFIASPRFSFLYKPFKNTQLRATWGMGFRAPQAFDADLHIAFAGGGISRISLAKNLKQERSNSFNISLNYDKPQESYIYGFSLEGFYTHLKDAFYLKPLGEDLHGQRFQKSNGQAAHVRGITLEGRFNYNTIFQLESGFTYQKSTYENPVENAENLPAKKEFLRTPNLYGYGTLQMFFHRKFKTALNYVYTGEMLVLHVSEAKNKYVNTKTFSDVGFKSTYTFEMEKLTTKIALSVGIKNIFDSYQDDFDIGKNRDSNFIYGPALPRTFFIALQLKPF